MLDMADGKGELCGRYLADLGADVVRVEPPGGGASRRIGPFHEGSSLHFATRNASKRGVALDVEQAGGRARLLALLDVADVWIETTRPGTLAALGLDADSVRARNPALVVLSISDFGQSGPYRDWVATEPVHAALGGVLSRSGLPGRTPLVPPAGMLWEAAAVQAAWGALIAYWNRLETGRGDHVDVSLFEAAQQALDPVCGTIGTASAAKPLDPTRDRPPAGLYPIFPCADGYVRIVVLAPRAWHALRDWIGLPERFREVAFDSIATRREHLEELYPLYRAFFADKGKLALTSEGQARGIPIAPVLDTADVLAAEHYRERGAIARTEIAPGVRADVPTGFVEVDGVRAGIRRRAPEVGEHDAEVLAEWAQPREATAPPLAAGAASAAAATPRRPLAGLRVLDLGVIVLGAEVARLFADQGAEVVKVESSAYPDGARESAHGFALGHRNSKSIGVNLRDPEGVTLFLKLVAASDVVLSNFKPGTLEKLGLGPDVLRAANPRIVTVASSAVGATGSWSGWAGYGPLVRCAADVTSRWRYPDDAGSFSDGTTIYPDHYGGRVAAVAGLAALIARRQHAGAVEVRSSQAEAILAEFSDVLAHESLSPGATAVPPGNAHPDAAPWGVYPCAGDDEWCAITVRDDEDWRRLRAVLGEPDWALDPAYATAAGRIAARDALDRELTAWTQTHAPRALAELLQTVGVPAGHMQRVDEVLADVHLHARGYFRTLQQPGFGPLTLENGPFVSATLPQPALESAPRFGEHTRALCAQLLGLGDAEIERLLAAGVIEADGQELAGQPNSFASPMPGGTA